jgi:hypothetical protein
MGEPECRTKPDGLRQGRFQFGLRRILWLTFACAVASALARSIGGPTIFKLVVAGYLIFLAAYVGLRLPYIVGRVLRRTPEWDAVRRKREELESLVAEKRRSRPAPTADDPGCGPADASLSTHPPANGVPPVCPAEQTESSRELEPGETQQRAKEKQ